MPFQQMFKLRKADEFNFSNLLNGQMYDESNVVERLF